MCQLFACVFYVFVKKDVLFGSYPNKKTNALEIPKAFANLIADCLLQLEKRSINGRDLHV